MEALPTPEQTINRLLAALPKSVAITALNVGAIFSWILMPISIAAQLFDWLQGRIVPEPLASALEAGHPFSNTINSLFVVVYDFCRMQNIPGILPQHVPFIAISLFALPCFIWFIASTFSQTARRRAILSVRQNIHDVQSEIARLDSLRIEPTEVEKAATRTAFEAVGGLAAGPLGRWVARGLADAASKGKHSSPAELKAAREELGALQQKLEVQEKSLLLGEVRVRLAQTTSVIAAVFLGVSLIAGYMIGT